MSNEFETPLWLKQTVNKLEEYNYRRMREIHERWRHALRLLDITLYDQPLVSTSYVVIDGVCFVLRPTQLCISVQCQRCMYPEVLPLASTLQHSAKEDIAINLYAIMHEQIRCVDCNEILGTSSFWAPDDTPAQVADTSYWTAKLLSDENKWVLTPTK